MRRRVSWAVIGTVLAGGCGLSSSLDVIRAALSDAPDYTITVVRAAPSALPNSAFDVTTTICNAGGVFAPPTTVQLVVSADTTIDLDDPVLGWGIVPGLQPQQCDTHVTQV